MAMLSKIRVGRNDTRDAVIKIELVDSEDMNDDVLKEFFNDLGHRSSFCLVEFKGQGHGDSVIAHLRPIKPKELSRRVEQMMKEGEI
jgi:hypothetical protein